MGRDIEIRFLNDGKAVGNFTLAVNGYKQGDVSWLRCAIFGKGAEILQKYTGKGSKLFVSGRLQQRTFEKDGQKRESVEVVVNDFQFLDTKRESSGGYPDPPSQSEPQEDDIPFA